jgi:3-hydroxyisobutyrate dehydrogenase
MRVTFLGTGIMGLPMARNAAAAGIEVRAWNRSPEKAEPLRDHGVEVLADPVDAIADADVVVTMVTDAGAVRAVIEGPGVLDAMRGRIWAQMSTIGIAATEEMVRRAAEAELAYVDAPVLGTRQPAEAGELTVLAAGPPEAKERCGELFDAVGSKTHWLGDEPGAGTRMKLALNTWVIGQVEALAETLALAERLGVDPARLLEVIKGGGTDSGYAQIKGRAMIERQFEPPSFPLRLAAKDAALALEAAEQAGLSPPMLAAVREQFERAVAAGYGEGDLAATFAALVER